MRLATPSGGASFRTCDISGAQWHAVYRIRRSRRHRPSADRPRYPESPLCLPRRPLTALAAPLLLLALAGAIVPEVQAADGTTPTATPSVTPPPQIASEAAGATAWSPAKPVRIKVTGGTLT